MTMKKEEEKTEDNYNITAFDLTIRFQHVSTLSQFVKPCVLTKRKQKLSEKNNQDS